jgi:hypothetical protein
MRILRSFFGGAETHPKQKANKEQCDVSHGISPYDLNRLRQTDLVEYVRTFQTLKP